MKKIIFILMVLLSVTLIANEIINSEIMTYSFTLLEIISLVTATISICLGIFAIWLTLHLKKEADSINKETKEILMEIKTDAKTITNGVFSEMEKWGNLGRKILTSSSQTETHDGINNSATLENANIKNSIQGTNNGK